MEYRLRLRPRIGWQIRIGGAFPSFSSWRRTCAYPKIFPQDPKIYLHRDQEGPGSLFAFDARDPDNLNFNHIFIFRVFLDKDE